MNSLDKQVRLFSNHTKGYKMNKIIFTILILLSVQLYSQDHYVFVRKSVSYLVQQMGEPNTVKNQGSHKLYRYVDGDGVTVYYIEKGIVTSALKNIRAYSNSQAKEIFSSEVQSYISDGFSVKEKHTGMTILQKGRTVIMIGLMNESGEGYTVKVMAT